MPLCLWRANWAGPGRRCAQPDCYRPCSWIARMTSLLDSDIASSVAMSNARYRLRESEAALLIETWPLIQFIFFLYSGYSVSGFPIAASLGTPYLAVISSTNGFFSGR